MTARLVSYSGFERDLELLTTGDATPDELLADARTELPAWQARLYVDLVMRIAARDSGHAGAAS
jgi:hypothetical protein